MVLLCFDAINYVSRIIIFLSVVGKFCHNNNYLKAAMCVSVVYVIYISYYFKMFVNDLFLIIKDENTTFDCLVNTFGNIFVTIKKLNSVNVAAQILI